MPSHPDRVRQNYCEHEWDCVLMLPYGAKFICWNCEKIEFIDEKLMPTVVSDNSTIIEIAKAIGLKTKQKHQKHDSQ